MKRVYSFVFFFLLISIGYAQPTLLRNWHPQSGGTQFRTFVQQQLIQYSRFVPTAPCRIDSVWMFFYSPDGGSSDVVMKIWSCDGGSIGPHLLNQLTDSNVVTITLAKGGMTGVSWKLSKPIIMNSPKPFCVGISNSQVSDPPIALAFDTTTQTRSCNATDIDFFTSAYGFWAPLSTGSQIQNLFFSGYVNFGVGDTRLMGNWFIDAFVTYYNVVGPTQKTFKDVTTTTGLSGASGRGIVWGDYDNDGYQDLLMTNKLYHNKGNGTFEDASAAAGYTGGSAVNLFVDVNNDGFLDIVCQPDNILYLNNNGVFTKVTDFGFNKSTSTTTVTAADFDNDKYPDIFVGNWERQDIFAKNPQDATDSTQIFGLGYRSYLYKNAKNNRFTDASAKLGGYQQDPLAQNPYTGVEVQGYRVVYGSGWSDFNNDGLQDLFVGCYRFEPNYLFVNNGTGSFDDDASRTTLAGHEKTSGTFAHTIGSDWGDYNNDGNMDILIANFSHPDWRHEFGDVTALYKNQGAPSYVFEDQQPGAGIAYEETHSDVGWGDYNNDGLLDFYITATYSCRKGTLYLQNSDNTFFDDTYKTGTTTTTSWGIAWVDYDNDGKLDLSVTDGSGFHLFRNQSATGNNKWTELRLKSTSSNDFAIGARVSIYAGGRKLTREVEAGKGSGSQDPYAIHAGLGAVFKIDSIAVRWPSGARDSWKNVPVNTVLDVTEGGTLPVAVANPEAPKDFELFQNYPNPFNPSTTIAFDIAKSGNAKIEIYNMLGNKVRTLVNRPYEPGSFNITWDGTDDNGNQLAGGSYMYILTAGETVLAKPMMYLK